MTSKLFLARVLLVVLAVLLGSKA